MRKDNQYNLNTKYGRRKAREQAQFNYDNGTPQYRSEIDSMGAVAVVILLVVAVVIFAIIYNVSGPEAAKKWLK